jgi:hypothetical protein
MSAGKTADEVAKRDAPAVDASRFFAFPIGAPSAAITGAQRAESLAAAAPAIRRTEEGIVTWS